MFKLPKAKAGNEWTEWKGGKCPFPKGTKVDVIYRDGYRTQWKVGNIDFMYDDLADGVWGHLGDECDIVAYRLSWIRHRGGKHPGEPGDKFVVRIRDGHIGTQLICVNDRDNRIGWGHFNHPYDIMAYKPVL
ncbi:hypothetical protein [Pseudomonas phage K4]|nr:hypothetical protein [Pseudomonas phage K4]